MLRRTGIVVSLSLTGMAAGVIPAFADGWGYSDCSQYPNPGCELAAGKGGTSHQGNEGDRTPGQSRGNPPERAHPSLGDNGIPGGDGSSAQRLRRRLRAQLSARLSERIRADEDAGHPVMTPAQRRALAESVLADAAEAHTQVEFARGGQLVAPEVEQRVIAGVLDEVFGLAGLELGLGDDAQAHPDVVAMQAREANIEGQGAITQSDLVWQSLRMSPDRVIVGEVRGPEVIPLTNAMNMGNDGSMGTLHCSTSKGAFTKLAAYAVQGPEHLPVEATNLLVASALHFVVHLAKARDAEGHRVVSSIREVIDADGHQIVSNEVWHPNQNLHAIPGVPLRSETLNALITAGLNTDLLDHACRCAPGASRAGG